MNILSNRIGIMFFCIISGCSSVIRDGGILFVDQRNYDVGRSVKVAPLEPTQVQPLDANLDKYVYEWRTGCKFAYIVDNETNVVQSWEYISAPEACYMSSSWSAPW